MLYSNAQQVPGDFSPAELDRLVAHEWSLEVYLAWLGRRDKQRVLDGWWVGSLTRDVGHWAEYGIHTASQLARELDLEYAKERRKADMAGLDEDWDVPGASDLCTQCGDMADYAGTGGQLCRECDARLEAAYRDEDPYRDLGDILAPPVGADDDMDDELSPALDVRLVANKLTALAVSGGWHAV